MVPLQGETAGVLTVPLRLADNQIALVGAVVFHHKPNTDGAYNVMMSLQARNDVEGVTDEGTHIALVDKSQDTIAVAVENNNETSNDETGVITKSQMILIPYDGYPVVGDMNLVFSRSGTAVNRTYGCDVYYTTHRVSAKEWLKFAKRSRNAPVDPVEPSVFNT